MGHNIVKICCLSKGTEDCFLIEIKFDDEDRLRLLIDGGKSIEYLRQYLKNIYNTKDDYPEIDYIIVTHIDSDHIKGIIDLYTDDKLNKIIGNAKLIYNYIVNCPEISYREAEELEKIVKHEKVIVTYKNSYKSDNSHKIMFLSYEDRKNKEYCYDSILEKKAILTFLNPTLEMITKVHDNYIINKKDAKSINRSSIVFLLEYKSKVLLFTGDCFLKDVVDKIDDIFIKNENENNKRIDFIKVPHHGAYDNNKEINDLIKKYNCNNIYVTCDEKDTKHPSKEFLKIIKNNESLNLYTNNVKNLNFNVLNEVNGKAKTIKQKIEPQGGIVL